ncbi:MAG: 6-carboxytetrahydropterin synthase [Phycisphaerales bacterium]|nr:6-carboxytetrahydropterin synthase [Phycisphaerales bacterium]
MTYAFEFSAAHRLYCASLNAEENRRLFGKCANPNGHGHNYVLEVTVRGIPDAASGVLIGLDALARIVNERVIERFDHKHLNLDCAEFAELNPSVENIARVIFEKLNGAFEPAALDCIRVYETPKTWAECRADA